MAADSPSKSTKTHILVYSPDRKAAEQCRSLILESVPASNVSCASSMTEAVSGIEEIEVLYGWMIPEALYARATSLRWIQKMGAGVDDIVYNPHIASDVVLTRTPGSAIAHTMADYVLAALLNVRLKTHLGYKLQREHQWREYVTKPLADIVVGIAGIGEVGTVIARRLMQLEIEVTGWRRTKTENAALAIKGYHGNQGLEPFLQRSDCVVLALPLTTTTHRIVDENFLLMMKNGSHLVNVGRGDLVDEDALMAALKTGRLGAATLDVVMSEPLDAQSSLWDCPNLVITPHVSGPTIPERVAPHFIDNLRRFIGGQKLRQIIDRHRGY